MWWWLSAALAGPTRTEAPTQRIAVPYPAGVTSALVSRELVSATRPAAVTFVVNAAPTVRDGMLVVHGVLTNTGSRSATVFLVSAPHTGGPLLLTPRGGVFTPPPASAENPPIPETPPIPEELVLPAGVAVSFESALRLDRWTWPESGSVQIDWTFAYWNDPAHGTLAGQLAKQK